MGIYETFAFVIAAGSVGATQLHSHWMCITSVGYWLPNVLFVGVRRGTRYPCGIVSDILAPMTCSRYVQLVPSWPSPIEPIFHGANVASADQGTSIGLSRFRRGMSSSVSVKAGRASSVTAPWATTAQRGARTRQYSRP